jgi:hypothetical protein
MQVPEERDFSHSFEMTGREKRKRDFSLRRPTHSQERMREKKSARSVRNDGAGAGDGHSKRKSNPRGKARGQPGMAVPREKGRPDV